MMKFKDEHGIVDLTPLHQDEYWPAWKVVAVSAVVVVSAVIIMAVGALSLMTLLDALT